MKVPALQSTSTTIQRQDWSVNYKTRLKKSLARNERVVDDKELTLFNYGEKFHHSICAEEQKHMDLLAEKYVYCYDSHDTYAEFIVYMVLIFCIHLYITHITGMYACTYVYARYIHYRFWSACMLTV